MAPARNYPDLKLRLRLLPCSHFSALKVTWVTWVPLAVPAGPLFLRSTGEGKIEWTQASSPRQAWLLLQEGVIDVFANSVSLLPARDSLPLSPGR